MKNESTNSAVVKSPGNTGRNPPPIPKKVTLNPDVKPSVDDRPSLPLERAEGEGMIAPTKTVEGEGSYTATHSYNAELARSVAAGNTERLAKEAAEALDGPEAATLRNAERAAKQGHSM